MRTPLKTMALLGVCLGLALAGCGRKGALDVPGQPVTPVSGQIDPAIATNQDTVQQRVEDDRTFFLDFLIQPDNKPAR